MNFVGNILTRVYTPYTDFKPAIVDAGEIRIQYRRGISRIYLKARDTMLIGWRAVEKEYDYTSLTYRKHLKVNKYKMLHLNV
jgi:hypothetical protein